VTLPYNATGTQELQGERNGGVMLSSAARRPWEIAAAAAESAKERSVTRGNRRKARIGVDGLSKERNSRAKMLTKRVGELAGGTRANKAREVSSRQ
jgi:hypothetical protein